MIGDGCMGENISQSRAISSSFMFNGDMKVLALYQRFV